MRVLALHGYGSSGAILAEQLRALSLAGDWVVSSPNAPIALPQGGFAWFLAKDPGPVYQGVEQSVDLLQAVVDKELQLYEQRRPVFDLIVGFSQGAVMALAFCARAKVPAHVRWRAALYLCAPPIRDVGLKSALEVKDPVNVLGFGTRDTIVSPVFMDDFVSLFPAGGRRLVLYHENHNPPHDAAATLEALRAPLTRRWFAFDFDGVLCDSARECGISAWLGCASLVQGADGTSFPPADILHRFCEVRPLLEHGFEALVLFFRLQTESVEDMLGAPDPAQRMDAARARMPGSPSVDELKARFKVARQKWIERDERGWLASNGFYAPMVDCLKQLFERQEAVYVITTKSFEFARRLLDSVGLRSLPDSQLFGLSALTKSRIISDLARDVQAAQGGGVCVFVEDRVETLVNVAGTCASPCELVLAGHGYNTARDKQRAAEAGFLVHGTAEALAKYLLAR